ncbi:MAG: deoxyguanosinetriphosphate triphosphohydrolase [Blautia sp.]|nr:deoxyguanosinetriphosphate triphosphohydrolase [Blautia sp.]
MSWDKLLSADRVGSYGKTEARSGDLRSEFEKDYHRIIGSSTFRRLQDKTQVFALDKSDFIRTRLTHSLEVSSFAKSLGQNIAEYLLANQVDEGFTRQTKADICDILMCAGLIHDIGNPPFGHFGEEAIRDWFRRRLRRLSFKGKPLPQLLNRQMLLDLLQFEGNAQALRQVAKLHFLVNENGMNLTYALLNTIIKYPVSSEGMNPESPRISEKKMGYFYAEQPLYEKISSACGTPGLRHPLTFILEAADDIAYRTADIEDAFKKGFITFEILRRELQAACEKARASHMNVDLSRLDPVSMLDRQYENGLTRGVGNPALYAVQNTMVRLHSAFIYCATYGFTSHYRQIMDGVWQKDLFAGTYAEWVIIALGDIAFHYAFSSKQILQMEVSAFTILNFLLDHFVPAVINYDTDERLGMMEGKMVALISENYRQIYQMYSRHAVSATEKLYLRLLLVTDFVSGMTDSYAKDLYQKLNGIT